jgi:hypothetical protein
MNVRFKGKSKEEIIAPNFGELQPREIDIHSKEDDARDISYAIRIPIGDSGIVFNKFEEEPTQCSQ